MQHPKESLPQEAISVYYLGLFKQTIRIFTDVSFAFAEVWYLLTYYLISPFWIIITAECYDEFIW